MKKNILFLLLLIVPFTIHSQTLEWLIFKNYQLPVIQKADSAFNQIIAIKNRKEKFNLVDPIQQKINLNSNPRLFSSKSLSIPDNFIVSIMQSNSGDIWIGTSNGGVAKFDGTSWINFNSLNSGLPSNTIYSLCEDRAGAMWFGTTNGLVKYDGINWRIFNNSNSKLPGNVIYSLTIDKNNCKWIGTDLGLVKYDDKIWKVYRSSNSELPNNRITSLAVDKNDSKWIGTFGGLARFDGKIWKVFKKSKSGLSFNDIYSINFEKNGEMIICTWGGGISKFDGSNWTSIKTKNSGIPDDFISSTVQDKKGNLWVGTLSGLAKYDGKTWNVFNTSNSKLPNNNIYSLLFDENENLWIGTENGLTVYKEGGIVFSSAESLNLTTLMKNNSVLLKWKNETGNNKMVYIVERKTDRSEWEWISTIVNLENNHKLAYLTFNDEYFNSGVNYYRIKLIDEKGYFKYSNNSEIKIGVPDSRIIRSTFYDTNTQEVKLQIALPNQNYFDITVFDVFGNEIQKIAHSFLDTGYYAFRIHQEKFPDGIYYCVIKSFDLKYFRKIVWQKANY